MLLAGEGISVARDERQIVKGVDVSLQAGELVGLIGPNGAGKSTLMSALVGLLPYSADRLEICDQPVAQWSRQELARLRAYLAQDHDVHWPISVEHLVALGRIPYGGGADSAAVQRAMSKTDLLGLAERPVRDLSGGELARVLLARMLAVEAPLQLLDEPIAGLDPRYQLEIMQLLRSEASDQTGVMVVLHDLALAARFCDRLILMSRGEVFAHGAPEDVLTEANLSAVYHVEAKVDFSVTPPSVVVHSSVYT